MLPDRHPNELTQLLRTLPCRIAIPEWYLELLGQRGPAPGLPEEQRRFVRFNYPVKAVMTCLNNLPALPRTPEPHLILCMDLSRNGLGFLHAEPLYPGEEVSLWLPTGCRTYVARRCRREQPQCYEIGVEVLA